MNDVSRKKFLQQSSLATILLLSGEVWTTAKEKPALAFSTLGCPDWTFLQVMDFAKEHDYTGLELRGIQRELDLTKCKEFNSQENRSDTLKKMEDHGLRFVDLGSSATMHIAEPADRQKNLEEGKRFITLAQQIKCPYIRVFPNLFPKDMDKQKAMDLIVDGLVTLGDFAKGSEVSVLIESHGDLVNIADIEKVLSTAAHDHVGLVWDVTNMWMITHEAPANAYGQLKKYIRHTHIKDAKMVDGKIQYQLMGKGEVPIFEAIDLLRKGGYKGYYSFEWEKLWHPEIAEPEIALADYPSAMKKHFES